MTEKHIAYFWQLVKILRIVKSNKEARLVAATHKGLFAYSLYHIVTTDTLGKGIGCKVVVIEYSQLVASVFLVTVIFHIEPCHSKELGYIHIASKVKHGSAAIIMLGKTLIIYSETEILMEQIEALLKELYKRMLPKQHFKFINLDDIFHILMTCHILFHTEHARNALLKEL